ncbi:MAG: ABC transporter permease [Chloroflexota bacterium]
MGRFVIRRLIQTVPLIIGITLITFSLANLVPGSPVTGLEFNPRTSQEDVDRIRESLGLNDPIYVRYFTWMSNVARGDLGVSMRNFRPVRETIIEKVPNTLLLTGTALALALIFSIPVGVYSAVRRNTWFDNASTAAAVAGFSMPTFWLGILAILLFSVKFGDWGLPSLPVGGAVDLRGGGGFWDRIEHLILPATTLAVVQTAAWTRYIRSQMLEVLNQDYMRTAHAKGLTEKIVVFRHGLRNAVLPLVTLLGIAIPDLFGGSLIIEQIFAYPGIGQLGFNAALNKDYPLVMGIVLFASVLVILGNLVADIVYGILDPRIRYD